MKKLTHLDANVLIDAARGKGEAAARAFAILDDSAREFASSIFLELELLPNCRKEELAFFDECFGQTVTCQARDLEAITKMARREAVTLGMGALDALHVAAAASIQAAELITRESYNKPIHKTQAVKVVFLG